MHKIVDHRCPIACILAMFRLNANRFFQRAVKGTRSYGNACNPRNLRNREGLGNLRSSRTSPNQTRWSSSSSRGPTSGRSKWYPMVLYSGGVLSTVIVYSLLQKEDPLVPINRKSIELVSDIAEPVYANPKELKQAISEIKEIIGKTNVHETGEIISEHADSAWQTRHPHAGELPDAVVYPKDTQEVSEVLKVCHKYRVPVIPFSGGTSLEGHFTPVYRGISLDVSRMDQILAVHKDDLDVVVQPAVGWEVLADSLNDYNLMFGPDPGPGAEIGGMVGTSCSGTNAYRYGTMRQNVVNLTVVLADGTIIKTKRRPRKSSAGYSLTELFIGSEGTLGVVTEATLKVYAKPPIRRVGMLTFDKIDDATSTVQDILQSGLNLDAVELMDDEQMKLINQAGTTDSTWEEKNSLLLRFAGSSENIINSEIEKVKELAKPHNSLNLKFASSEDESEELWSARKNALWSTQSAAKPGSKMWTTDVAVPISKLSKLVHDCKQQISSNNLTASIIGHVGDGNFHCCIAYDPTDKKEKEIVETIVDNLVNEAIDLEGTCTGEHGVGVGKRGYLLKEVGPETVGLMRQIKSALDPYSILNPGHVFTTSHNDVPNH